MTTGVTNLDIHDLARAARTYGAAGYFVVTPIEQQRALVSRIAEHWRAGGGPGLHPQRASALALVRVASTLEDARAAITGPTGSPPLTVGTTARTDSATVGYETLRSRLVHEDGAALLVFGTGWGLTGAALASCDAILPPIEAIAGRAGYNHLSVRSAVAIILDRLLGARSESLPGVGR